MIDPAIPVPPGLEFVAELRVVIGPIMEIGTRGSVIMRVVPTTGGDFTGPKVRGRVLPGGADWQSADSRGLTAVDAHCVLETDDSVRIEVRNREYGMRRRQCWRGFNQGNRLARMSTTSGPHRSSRLRQPSTIG